MQYYINILLSILRKASKNRKLYVFLMCLSLASFFWLLNALSKTFSTSFEYEIVYVNYPKGKVVVNNLPTKLEATVKGLGYSLLANQFNYTDKQVLVDLSILSSNNAKTFTYNTENLIAQLHNKLKDNLQVVSCHPNTIRFNLSEKITKILPVKLNSKLQFLDNYKLNGNIKIVPAAVKVSGPKSILDTIKSLKTSLLEIVEIDEQITTSVGFAIDTNANKYNCSPNNVIVQIPVQEFKTTSLLIPLSIINQPDSITTKLLPNRVEVVFDMPISQKLEKNMFKAIVDYNTLAFSTHKKLNVTLKYYPNFITNFELKPNKVDYIIENKTND